MLYTAGADAGVDTFTYEVCDTLDARATAEVDESGQIDAPAGAFSAVSVTTRYSCGLRTSGAIACWGWPSFGLTTAPEGAFSAVSAGSVDACGLRVDATVVCWGYGDYRMTNKPVGEFSAVSAGSVYACEAYLTLRDGSGWDSGSIRWSLAGCGW